MFYQVENTSYGWRYHDRHPTIQMFWEVFDELTEEQRKDFLRSGRCGPPAGLRPPCDTNEEAAIQQLLHEQRVLHCSGCRVQTGLSLLTPCTGSVLQQLGGRQRLVQSVCSRRSGLSGRRGCQFATFNLCSVLSLAARSAPSSAGLWWFNSSTYCSKLQPHALLTLQYACWVWLIVPALVLSLVNSFVIFLYYLSF
ncbi:uncharacterized protein LOC113024578 isoform X1 [Astatotilapia calliptera]|uniref:uncharacterized protein LOC113024578 isoform X1 n=1 Tax=Astatotilapia calliptera TaxID=8154 RepID=UPI000E4224AF|nr:uncharacterized protein LOC113024578 isoform X1 [Astatotilapia calliptera]